MHLKDHLTKTHNNPNMHDKHIYDHIHVKELKVQTSNEMKSIKTKRYT